MAKILCVDTDELNGRYVLAQLKAAGHVCILENRGERVLALVEEHGAELVLTEVMIPDVCGFEICRRIRMHPEWFSLPVILMSSMSAPDEVAHGLAQGADDYLAKPIDPKQLLARVANQLKEAGDASRPDAVTQLANARRMKTALQQAISKKADFALAYLEIVSLTPFAKMVGVDKRDKALRHLARILERYGEKAGSQLFRAAHMGGGHFLCLLEPKLAEMFCAGVAKSWENHLPEFYASLGLNAPGEGHTPVLNLAMCITDNAASGARSAKECFDTLAQLRQKALAAGYQGIHFDSRRGLK